MAIEQSWSTVAPQAFTSDGTDLGVVTIGNTAGFKVKQQIIVSMPGLPDLTLQCKRVSSPTQLIVGPIPTKQGQSLLSVRTDISAYTVLGGAFIYAEEQPKVVVKPDDIEKAVYEQEPTVGLRSVLVDQYGSFYTEVNPLPVSATINVSPGTIPLNWTEIDLSYDINNNLTEVDYKVPASADVILTLSYDINNNLTKVVAS